MVRIRRVEDERRLLGRRARYEIEWRGQGQHPERVVTTTPGRDLRPLLGSGHPADVSAYTEAADLAWDGGVGQWRTGPAFAAEETDPAAGGEGPMAPAEIEARAAALVERRVGQSPAGALAFLAAMLDRVGHRAVATPLGEVSREWMATHDEEGRARLAARVEEVWAEQGVPQLRPVRGSATEWAVCQQLIARVPGLLAGH